MINRSQLPLTAAHWGISRAEVHDGKLKALHPFEHDPDPSTMGDGYLGVLDDDLRIKSPMVRKSWLENSPQFATNRCEKGTFVEVSWERAEKLVAEELQRVSSEFGNQAIYGGSYGWSSAGRFHHAQSQLHRFLNCNGGYTRSVNTYSLAAGEVILSHIVGEPFKFIQTPTPWQSVIDHTQLLVAFGGLPFRNAQISSGGTGRHRAREALKQAKEAGISIVNVSPIRNDVEADMNAQWIAGRPGSDVAIMLGLAHEIMRNDWHDVEFLRRYTVGFDRFAFYLIGDDDGMAKSAEWASEIANISATDIKDLAKRMAHSRTVISTSWSLTRQQHGEQPFWMGTTLAAMLGQIGLPGGGIAYGYCTANSVGNERLPVKFSSLPQLKNPVEDFIPVSRISDMLLNPGKSYQFNGRSLNYPDIQLVYWAGGNPFHHHQDLTRFCKAWEKPQTVIVHEWCWNTLAKYSDIVLPSTIPLERDDLMLTPRDPFLVAMKKVVPPVGEARDDYDIFRGIGRQLGTESEFSEGRTAKDWMQLIYDQSQEQARQSGVELPDYEDFNVAGWHEIKTRETPEDAFTAFRRSPEDAPLATPSGKIEILSSVIATMQGMTILPHPAWYPPDEWLGAADQSTPFHLITNQPAEKLHSQLDHGLESRNKKRNGRTPVHINPSDAIDYQIADGDTVRIYNRRGACLGTATLDNDMMPGVLKMSTGAWFDGTPQLDGTLLCKHGNPNTVTRDMGTSELAQGPTAHSCLVGIEISLDDSNIQAFNPPSIEPDQL